MERIELNTALRTGTGKGNARKIRSRGEIPAILYGPNTENMLLSLNTMDFDRIVKKSRTSGVLFNLTLQNEGGAVVKSAMIKEIQRHPLSRKYLHVDFYEVSMDRKIRVKIPVVTKGKSKGVEFGGLLQIIRREVEVLCFPNQIPDQIEVDITELGVGESIHVRDLQPPEHVEIPADVNFTIVTVLGAKAAASEEGAAAPTEESVPEPEVKAKEGKEGKPGKQAKE